MFTARPRPGEWCGIPLRGSPAEGLCPHCGQPQMTGRQQMIHITMHLKSSLIDGQMEQRLPVLLVGPTECRALDLPRADVF